MKKYNWETIKRQYIHGIKKEDGTKIYPSYKDLSQLHGPSKSTISDHSTNDPEGTWEEQRERYQNKVERKVEDQKSQIEAENIVEAELMCESLGRKIIRVVDKKFTQMERKLDNDKHVPSIEILNASSAGRNGQAMVDDAQEKVTNRIKIDSNQYVKLHITDPDFMEQELDFANKLIDKRKEG